MAEEEKNAPGSDAASKATSESVFPNDTPTQAGASMGVSTAIHNLAGSPFLLGIAALRNRQGDPYDRSN